MTVFVPNLWERLCAAQEGSRAAEPSVSQPWQTKKHCLCLLQPGPQMPSTSGLVAPPWRIPVSKTELGRGKWPAAGYLRSLQMLPFLFPLTREAAGTDKPLPGVKPCPPFMLNRTHFALVWRQVVSSNLRISKMMCTSLLFSPVFLLPIMN